MGPLGARTRSTCLAVLAVTLGIAAVSAGVRLLPWIFDTRVPWGAVAVFARGLTAVALEATAAVGLPLGYVLAAAGASDTGEARACGLMGASPWGLAARTWPIAAGVVALAVGAGLAWGGPRAEPSRVVGDLARASRDACGPHRPVAEVPGTGAAWLCAEGQAARLAVIAGDAVVVAERVAFSPGRVELAAATLALRGPPEVRIRIQEATVAGLASFDAPAGTPGRPRGIVLVVASGLAALAAMSALLARGEARRTVAAALGGGTATLALVVSMAVERGGGGLAWLASIPLAAFTPTLLYLAAGRWAVARERAALRAGARGGTSLRDMGRIGPGEILLLALLALLLFGASRISDIGKGLGEGIKNFKKGLKDDGAEEPPKQLEKGTEGEKKALSTPQCPARSPAASTRLHPAPRSR